MKEDLTEHQLVFQHTYISRMNPDFSANPLCICGKPETPGDRDILLAILEK